MNTKLIRSNEVVWEELDGQALLVHSRTGERWTLNAAALALWKLCDGTRTVELLDKALAEVTRRSLTECREELERLTQSLTGTGLLQCSGAEGSRLTVQPAQFSVGGILRATYQGNGLGAPRRRPSPRGNSGPG